MSDPQQPSQYPGFAVTAEGIQKLHQALGMYLHQALEQDIAARAQQEQHRKQVEMLLAGPAAPDADAEQAPPVPLRTPKAQGGGA